MQGAETLKKMLHEVAFMEGHVKALEKRIGELLWNVTGKKGRECFALSNLDCVEQEVSGIFKTVASVVSDMYKDLDKPCRHYVERLEKIIQE